MSIFVPGQMWKFSGSLEYEVVTRKNLIFVDWRNFRHFITASNMGLRLAERAVSEMGLTQLIKVSDNWRTFVRTSGTFDNPDDVIRRVLEIVINTEDSLLP